MTSWEKWSKAESKLIEVKTVFDKTGNSKWFSLLLSIPTILIQEGFCFHYTKWIMLICIVLTNSWNKNFKRWFYLQGRVIGTVAENRVEEGGKKTEEFVFELFALQMAAAARAEP